MAPAYRTTLFLAAVLALLALRPAVFGDEGLWLFNGVPKDQLKKKYNFDAEQKWLDHVQRARTPCAPCSDPLCLLLHRGRCCSSTVES